MSSSLSIIICGFTGRMGQAIGRLALADPRIQILGAVTRSNNSHIGKDVGTYLQQLPRSIFISDSLENAVAATSLSSPAKPVVIDFSHSDLTSRHAQIAARHQLPLIVGVTALDEMHHQALEKAAHTIPILVSSNMSLGANILFALTKLAARLLKDADVEINEIHHRGKKDCPSGTAYQLAKTVAEARNQNFKDHLVLNRAQEGSRKPGQIGVTGLRAGNAKGTHSVYFFGDNEYLELKHNADNANIFAEGTLKAAWYLVSQKAGLHNMADVLGIKTLQNL